jgi:hypothetical protein
MDNGKIIVDGPKETVFTSKVGWNENWKRYSR